MADTPKIKRPGMVMAHGNGEKEVSSGPDKESKDQTNINSPRKDSMDGRPGATMMPGNGETGVSTGGGGTGGGGIGGNAGGGGGGGNGGGGGGGSNCEERNCNCGDVEGQIEDYNSAIEELKDLFSKTNMDKLQEKLKSKFDQLQNILDMVKYEPSDPQTSGLKDGQECGTCGELKRHIESVMGTQAATLLTSCCGMGANGQICDDLSKPAFSDANNPGAPDADNRIKATLLPEGFKLWCDNPPEGGDSKKITLKKLKCEPVENDGKCDPGDRIQIVTTEEEIEIASLTGSLKNAMDRLKAVADYFKKLKGEANNTQNLGGKASSLAKEACFVAMLDRVCSRLTGEGSGSGRPMSPGCTGAAFGGRTRFKQGRDIWSICDQLGHELAWNHSLTYSHQGNVTPGHRGGWDRGKIIRDNEVRDQEQNASSTDCARRVKATSEVFVSRGGAANAKEAAIADLKRKSETFGGCVMTDKDGKKVPPEFVQLLGQPVPCGGPGERSCTCEGAENEAADIPQEVRDKYRDLKAQATIYQQKLTTIEHDMNQNNAAQDAIINKNPKSDKDNERLARLKEIQTELSKTLQKLKDDNKKMLDDFDKVKEQMRGIAPGFCVTYEYTYCPANSTPLSDVGGRQGGGNTKGKETDHSNFYDLIRQLRDDTTVELADCDGKTTTHSPFTDAIEACWNQEPNWARDPMGNSGNDDGPTVSQNTPCEGNNNVRTMDGRGPCNQAADTDRSKSRQNCIKKLGRITRGLTAALQKAGWKSDNSVKNFTDIVKAIENIEKKLTDDMGDPPPLKCKGDTADKAIQRIKEMKKAIDALSKKIEDLDLGLPKE